MVTSAMTTSVDGYVAGPDDGPEQPLGRGGQQLFDWYENGDTPSRFYPSFRMSAVSAALFDSYAARAGAVISGRRTYDIANGWNGDGPLPGCPLFVLTHHVPETVPAGRSPYTFVTDGIESAVAQARAVAGDNDVGVMGARAIQECLRAGLLDELTIHLRPMVLGGGVRLLDGLDPDRVTLDLTRVVDAPGVTHLTYRVGPGTASATSGS